MTAITELAQRRQLGKTGDRLPESERPQNFEQAFALQLAIAKQYSAQDPADFAGWKCLKPLNENTVVAGLFEQEKQMSTGEQPFQCSLHANANNEAAIEPELAFELCADLPPRVESYTEAEVDAAIGKTRIAFELIQSRYRDPSEVPFLEALADGLLNQGIWLGPEIKQMDDNTHANIQLSFQADGEEALVLSGAHPNSQARAGLYWLANFLSQQGIGMKQGQQIITGSYAGVLKLQFNKNYRVSYQDLGGFSLSFWAK